MLGPLETLVLGSVCALSDEAYGVSIERKATELAFPERVPNGSIYVTLDRLLKKGLVSERWSEPMEERGGRRRRYYKLEGVGVKALHDSLASYTRIQSALVPVQVGGAG